MVLRGRGRRRVGSSHKGGRELGGVSEGFDNEVKWKTGKSWRKKKENMKKKKVMMWTEEMGGRYGLIERKLIFR